jgi:lysophospholipase L1-like esterase
MSLGLATWILCTALLPVGTALPASAVDPSDPDILYTGRWADTNPSQPWSYWIGSSIIARFEGTSITATFSAGYSSDLDYLRVIIDDDVSNSVKIAVGTSPASYSLASGLADTVHRIEIIKETDTGDWLFSGFQLDPGRSLAPLPPRPARRIEFYGDSNLAGYSLESERNESGRQLRGTYFGFAGIASRILDAEYQNVSRSGATISGIHDRFDQISYWSATPTWNFAAFPADAVVVNLGANDVGRPKVQIKQDYHAFLDDLRAVHPAAHILLYNGWGWDYDEPANYIHEVIAERGDPQMSSATFPWLFEQWHGCEYDHAGMAQLLADHLTALLGWPAAPRDVMSGFGTDGDVANGSFEETAPFGGYGWRYRTAPGVSRITSPAEAFDGDRFLRLTSGAATHQPLPAQENEVFTVTAWIRGGALGDEVAITLDFRDQEMWTPPLQTTTETMTLSPAWQRYSMRAIAPAGTTNPVYHARLTFTAVAGATVDLDRVEMRVGDPSEIPTLPLEGLVVTLLLLLGAGSVVLARRPCAPRPN